MIEKGDKANHGYLKSFKSVGLAFTLRAFGAVCAFALNVAIGRLLGANGAGLYYLALSVSSIGSVVARLGMDHAVLRFVAFEIANNNWRRAAGVFVLGVKVATASGFVLSLAILGAAGLISEQIFGEPDLSSPLRWIAFSIVNFSLMLLVAESLKGLNRVRDAMLVSGVIYPVVALVLIWPLSAMAGVSGAAMAYVLGTGIATLFGLAVWRSQVPLPWTKPKYELAVLWSSANKLWVMALINSAILPWAPLFLLGIWGSIEDTGIFGAATRIATVLTFLLTAVNTVAAPRFSKLYANADIAGLKRLASRFALLVTLGASPIFVLMIVSSDWLMGLFGPGFARGGAALSVLALGQVVNAATGSVGVLLMMTGHEKDLRNSAFFAGALMGLSALILIPSYGLIGAAISSSVALGGMNLFNAVLVKLRMGFLVVPR